MFFQVADFSENEAPKRQLDLESLFLYPEFLDRFRTQVAAGCQFFDVWSFQKLQCTNFVVHFFECHFWRHFCWQNVSVLCTYICLYNTQVNYCVNKRGTLRRVTEEELEFCKYRTLVKVHLPYTCLTSNYFPTVQAVDYIRSLSELDTKFLPTGCELLLATGGCGEEWLSVQDKVR